MERPEAKDETRKKKKKKDKERRAKINAPPDAAERKKVRDL